MKKTILIIFALPWFLLQFGCTPPKEVVITTPKDSSPRIEYGVQRLAEALENQGYTVCWDTVSAPNRRLMISVGFINDYINNFRGANFPVNVESIGEEGFALFGREGRYLIAGSDASGILYGCLELGERIRQKGKLPGELFFSDSPKMKLRGTCIGMQKTYVIPGQGQYNYPYTPELFPFFYDKKMWVQYLDMLVENRFNSLYLWNGHPFSSLVRLDDYPYAVDVEEETFRKNEEVFSFLTREADKRGIWVIQKFYNIHVGKNFAEHNGLPTHTGTTTPLLEDYTRKSLAAFVEKYPNVGMLVCLGEALGPADKDIGWLKEVIIPGVKEGLKKLGTDKEPPLVIRGHNTDPPAVIEAALPMYKNLYTMSKYNGEALTTYTPRGPWAETHRKLASLGSTHIDNVHLLANLEPFRWASPDFIQKSVQAMHRVHHANGLHLYPQAAYWDWPYSADKTAPRLYQINRDWLWYKAWGRYAWDGQRDSVSEKKYWIEVLENFYGCRGKGSLILDALQESGECAPKGLRRFGITNGGRQCYALGMFMDQLVNRDKYRPWVELWRSDSPEGEGLEEYVEKAMKGLPHKGETPPQIAGEIKTHGEKAAGAVEKACRHIRKNREEFERLRNDIHCTSLIADFYSDKSKAAEYVLRYKYNKKTQELDSAVVWLEKSVQDYRQLAARTKDTYLYAASLHDGARRIPVSGADGKNTHWTDVLPMYEKELAMFKVKLAQLKEKGSSENEQVDEQKFEPAAFELLSQGMEKYTVKEGEAAFTDSKIVFEKLVPALVGLTGVRFSEKAALQNGTGFRFRVNQPVYVLVGYFNTDQNGFVSKPNLETDVHADERGGLEPVIRDGATFIKKGMNPSIPAAVYPGINVHACKFKAGTHEMSFDKGRILVLGIIGAEKSIIKKSGKKVNKKNRPVSWLFE